ncbi:MAG: hypothetical protein ACOYMA_16505 [Bacteroidia bacterium]
MKVYIISSNQKTLNKVIITGLYFFVAIFILSSILNVFSALGVLSGVLIFIGFLALIISVTLLFIKWINKKHIFIDEECEVSLIINSEKSLIEITSYKDILYQGNYIEFLNKQYEISNKQTYKLLNSSLTKNIIIESKQLKEFDQDPIDILKNFDSL